jgi:hypothetical protein
VRARIDGKMMIAAPMGQVFDMVADERNELRYNPGIVRAELITDLHLVTGGELMARYGSMVDAWPLASARWRIPRS